MIEDYRQSHKQEGKGASYELFFNKSNFSSVIWILEKSALDKILINKFGSNEINYLDFACGTGRILSYLSPRVKKSTGIDVSKEMLVIAEKHCKKSILIEGDITKDFVFSNEQFDLITAFRFFPNAQTKLREEVLFSLSKLLKPEGRLIFNNHKNSSSLLYRLAHFIKPGSFQFGVNNEDLENLAKKAGFKIEQKIDIGLLPIPDSTKIFFPLIFFYLEKLLSKYIFLNAEGQNTIFVLKKNKV